MYSNLLAGVPTSYTEGSGLPGFYFGDLRASKIFEEGGAYLKDVSGVTDISHQLAQLCMNLASSSSLRSFETRKYFIYVSQGFWVVQRSKLYLFKRRVRCAMVRQRAHSWVVESCPVQERKYGSGRLNFTKQRYSHDRCMNMFLTRDGVGTLFVVELGIMSFTKWTFRWWDQWKLKRDAKRLQ